MLFIPGTGVTNRNFVFPVIRIKIWSGLLSPVKSVNL